MHTRTATDVLCVLPDTHRHTRTHTDSHGRPGRADGHPQTSCVYRTDSPHGPKSPIQSTGRASVLSPRTSVDAPQYMDQYMEPGQDGAQDDQIIPTEVQAADRSRQTDRAVYRINPRASGKELRLEPRPDDRTDRTTSCLPRPT